MKYTFEIGKKEKRQIKISVNKLLGKVKIWSNDKEMFNSFFMFGGDDKYEMIVGKEEKHEVKIILKKPILFAMFRKWWIEVYVDGEHFKTLK